MFKEEAIEMAQSFSKGEQKGFAYFFANLYPALTYYAFRITGDKPTAEDAVENSFVKIWERKETFTHHLVIKAWLYTTVRNECLNRLQTIQRMIKKNEELLYYSDSEDEPIENGIIRAEVVNELHAAINKLPCECSKIFKLMFIEGKSVREISQLLNIRISTVKNQKARGLMLLRRRMLNPR